MARGKYTRTEEMRKEQARKISEAWRKRTEEERRRVQEAQSKGMRRWWASLSEERRREIREAISEAKSGKGKGDAKAS